MTSIADYTFYNCHDLTSVTIPNSVTSIGRSAFQNCNGLTSVTIGNSVTSIGSDAFSGCSGLTKAYFPNIESLCVISFGNRGANPLSCARHLYIDGAEVTRVVIPNSVTSIGDFAFSGCRYLTSVTIPNSVTSIGSYAFYKCGDNLAPGGLDSVTIPNSVTSIGDYAFAYCNRLTSVTIPYSVTSIGRGAFYECKYLKSITVYIKTPLYIEPGTFYKYNGATLNVPYGSKEAYMKADSWKNFEFIVEVAPIVPATGISLNTISISLSTIGQTSQLIATITPNGATNKSITWTSDNMDVATVSSTGVVTAVANGTAIITATTNDGSNLSATCAVTVNISPTITFEDPNVKAICVANWDTNEDGELSKEEAAAVTGLGTVFKGNTEITSFNELQHFTGLTEIPSQAFMGCSNLMSVLIPDNVTTIGVSSFSGCVRLSSVTIPEGVTTISPTAYNDCLSLTSIHIPASVTDIGILAFNIQQVNYSSSGFHSVRQSITVAEGNTKYDSRENCNALIETATNKLLYGCANTTIPSSVSAIAGNAFSNSIITSIVIPNSVLSIGSGAFAYCNSLSSVTVELETPLTIASVTFTNRASATLYVPAGCKAVYEKADYWKEFGTIVEMEVSSPAITFADNNVKAICVANWDTNEDGELSEEEAAAVTDLGIVFKGNTSITTFNELQYFTGLTEIPSQAFMGCSNLTSVVIPDNITSIGYSAFDDCYALSSINLPSTITFIDGAAFSDCHSLTSITLPEGIPSMGNWFFDNCTGLTEIVIPSSVTTIGQSAFQGCTGLISIVIPENVTSISESTFNGCSGLTSVTIPESVASIGGYAFYGCENLTSVSLPGSVGTIGELAFQNCRNLESINIPDGITEIKGYTFCGCGSLKSIEIPESVTSIGELAFYACDNLVFVSVKNVNPVAIIEDVFSTRANALLYIPAGSKVAYEAADYWKDFKRILEMAVIDNEETYYIQNVETGLFLGAGNAWGTHAVLKNEGLPVKFTLLPDGSYTIYFLEGSQHDQLLFRATSEDIYVDYQGQSDGSPFWTITEASDGNYHIQTLITHELYGQEAMPGTYLGNNPNKEAHNQNGEALGVYNDVDGDILDVEGMNVTWRLVPKSVVTHSGDVNGDNQVSIADVTALVNIILGKDNSEPYQYDHKAADVNNDGNTSIADVTALVNIILGKQ